MRILHVFRSPVGGLFRHVRDLVRGQSALGHTVGVFCDSSTGGANAAQEFHDNKERYVGGIVTRPIARNPTPTDIAAISECVAFARSGQFDIIHCHGAKGGLIGRLAARRLGLPSLYTPHFGVLNYEWASPAGAAFLATEVFLARVGSGFVFVCDYEKRTFESKLGTAGKPFIVAHNGLWPDEFKPVVAKPDATDLVFVGELRPVKGVDFLLAAMAQLRGKHRLSLTAAGEGPLMQHYTDLAFKLGLGDRVTFAGHLPIREALSRGRMMVVPSRKESFPYVVLETIAAGVPIVATHVGGVPEALPESMTCHPNAESLAASIDAALTNMTTTKTAAEKLALAHRDQFSAANMTAKITDFYGALLR